ncbi:3-methyl-2-oxobutanoate hydroxymethyltransferase [Buchnera aphidicola (Neophyllaphis podocarpi)]|uniref:3-methyl-2-oxobutanoate hydroxymethyltransferase n=1 Tax=Buchnera aphidicola TaxID=9 RepID=UPI0034647885
MNSINIKDIYKWKKKKYKFAVITTYDYTFSKIFYNDGIKIMLVGDSLGMTFQGNKSTISVTTKDIIYHTKAVRKGSPNAFIISDLPFMSYSTKELSYENASKIIRSGANMVKIEGGKWLKNTIKKLTERSIPVCAHIGLKPQSINILGNYKVQGNTIDSANKILEEALSLEKAGAQIILIECVPYKLAKKITEKVKIPIIGIGAGKYTDGQVIVMHDALGLTEGKIPKFVKIFSNNKKNIIRSIKKYIKEVELEIYPSKEHSFF